MTTVKTSSWFTSLPPDHLKIGISRGTPRGMKAGYRRYTKLNPGPWFNSTDTATFIQLYQTEILDQLDPHKVAAEVAEIAGDRIPTLVCFERVGGPQWCHRALVSSWFLDTIGLVVPEFGFEHLPQGQHPLRPPPAPAKRPADPLARFLWPTPRR